MWWLAGRNPTDRGTGWRASRENAERLQHVNADDGRWQLRVTGRRDLALRAGDADYYWDGQFIVPLVVDTIEDVAPDIGWTEAGKSAP
jgi:hypothetical protein